MGLISEQRHRQTNLVGSDMVGLCKNGWFLAETEYGIQVYHEYFSEGNSLSHPLHSVIGFLMPLAKLNRRIMQTVVGSDEFNGITRLDSVTL